MWLPNTARFCVNSSLVHGNMDDFHLVGTTWEEGVDSTGRETGMRVRSAGEELEEEGREEEEEGWAKEEEEGGRG